MRRKILIVEDEPNMSRGLKDNLEFEGYDVDLADNGAMGLKMILANPYALIVMDVMMPEMSGLDVCKKVRDAGIAVPIIMLTAKSEEIDKILGLELGADDYVTKPFSLRELLARIRAVLRRSQVEAAPPSRDETLRAYRFAGWELNVRLHRLKSPEGKQIDISRGEFSLLCALLSSPQRILTRDQLLELSRLHCTEVYDRSIDVQ